MKKIIFTWAVLLLTIISSAQVLLYESFDYVDGIVGNESYEWKLHNASDPLGTDSEFSWYQADMTMGIDAYMGFEAHGYIQADKFATLANTGGTISNWLISPVLIISDGDSVRFHAVSYDNIHRPDKIEVRISTLGSESVLPSSATGVGSFNILIGVINPDLTTTGFPSVQNNQSWTRYSFPVAGINAGNQCRVALRYCVPNAGIQGPNASIVGIDEFYITGPEGYISAEETTKENTVNIFPNPASDFIRISLDNNQAIGDIQILDTSGRIVYVAQKTSTNNPIDISFLGKGIYILKTKTSGSEWMNTRFVKQ